MKSFIILIISIYEVTSYMHPLARPYYTRGPRPRETSYAVDPRFQQVLPTAYPYAVPEIPGHYPVYPKPVEKPYYQIYQQAVEPNPANYPIIHALEPNRAEIPLYQHALEPNPINLPVYQRALDPNLADLPIYLAPVEPNPARHPIYQPIEIEHEIQPIVPPAPKPAIKKKAGVDSNVLNNLAIALQLLIINNLINDPVPNIGVDSIRNAIDGSKAAVNIPYEVEELMNAKFLGSSNFDDATSIMRNGGYGTAATSPRVGALLKSPYDYLSENPSKSNQQNPYAAIFSPDNIKELFTMSDYY